MNRYLLFQGPRYYPWGGWEDYKGDFESLNDAIVAGGKLMAADGYGWYHVVDIQNKQIITKDQHS